MVSCVHARHRVLALGVVGFAEDSPLCHANLEFLVALSLSLSTDGRPSWCEYLFYEMWPKSFPPSTFSR